MAHYRCPDAAAAVQEFSSMRVFRNLALFLRRAPWIVRLRVTGSVVLLSVAAIMFAVGNPVIGIIAASIYILDLAIVGPILLRRASREQAPRR